MRCHRHHHRHRQRDATGDATGTITVAYTDTNANTGTITVTTTSDATVSRASTIKITSSATSTSTSTIVREIGLEEPSVSFVSMSIDFCCPTLRHVYRIGCRTTHAEQRSPLPSYVRCVLSDLTRGCVLSCCREYVSVCVVGCVDCLPERTLVS